MAAGNPLIVGLGNPGNRYRGTRHNVGFEVLDKLAEELRIDLANDSRANALVGWGRGAAGKVGLMKPLTLMNRSGQAVRHIVNYNNIEPADTLVIYDDLNLPVGRIRLRPGGGAGGHNGLQNIINQLQTKDIPRLRIGIGNDYDPGEQSNYVLSRFTPEQREEVDIALQRAVDAVHLFLDEGIEAAMTRYN